ncbi:MAG TPA: hypothetical protein VHE83_17775, partial [Mycobacteriales bacterium]|nr:hypothetical protein [Mycobacteriales bacterium]
MFEHLDDPYAPEPGADARAAVAAIVARRATARRRLTAAGTVGAVVLLGGVGVAGATLGHHTDHNPSPGTVLTTPTATVPPSSAPSAVGSPEPGDDRSRSAEPGDG